MLCLFIAYQAKAQRKINLALTLILAILLMTMLIRCRRECGSLLCDR